MAYNIRPGMFNLIGSTHTPLQFSQHLYTLSILLRMPGAAYRRKLFTLSTTEKLCQAREYDYFGSIELDWCERFYMVKICICELI